MASPVWPQAISPMPVLENALIYQPQTVKYGFYALVLFSKGIFLCLCGYICLGRISPKKKSKRSATSFAPPIFRSAPKSPNLNLPSPNTSAESTPSPSIAEPAACFYLSCPSESAPATKSLSRPSPSSPPRIPL